MEDKLSRIIKNSRISNNLSLRDLANICGISHAQLSKVENGIHIPSSESLLKISEALNLDYSFLSEIANKNTNSKKKTEELVNNHLIEIREGFTRIRIFLRDNFTCRLCGKGPPQDSIEVFYFLKDENGINFLSKKTQEEAFEKGITVCSKCQSGLHQMLKEDAFEKTFEQLKQRIIRN